MAIAARIKRHLDAHGISYQIFAHPRTVTLDEAAHQLNLNPCALARAVVVSDQRKQYVLVLPLNFKVNFATLEHVLGRPVTLVPRERVDRIFFDCEPGSHPPLGEPYGLDTWIDRSLRQPDVIFFEPGSHSTILQVAQDDFHYLTANATWVSFAVPINAQACNEDWVKSPCLTQQLRSLHAPNLAELGELLLATYHVPKPDALAETLYRSHPEHPADLREQLKEQKKLSKVVQDVWQHLSCMDEDPYLASQVACSLHLSQAFRMPETKPLGRSWLLLHALVGLEWVHREASAQAMPHAARRLLCQVALFQHLGWYLTAHLFLPEYRLLNKMVLFNSRTPIHLLEKRLLGMGQAQRWIAHGHHQLGAWLVHHWGWDASLASGIASHHASQHPLHGLNSMWKYLGLGDGSHMGLAGFDEGRVQSVRRWWAEHQEGLTQAVKQFGLHTEEGSHTQKEQPLEEGEESPASGG